MPQTYVETSESETRRKLKRHLRNLPLQYLDAIEITSEDEGTRIKYSYPRQGRDVSKTRFEVVIRGKEADICDLQRSSNLRGKDIGRKIYLGLEKFFKEEGCTMIWLYALNGKRAAFWQSLGFEHNGNTMEYEKRI